jgi:type IV fimbrial biogenesis protein FimT
MRTSQRGFSLIEVMIALTVLGILISLGAPAFSGWLQSQQIRAAADAILNGMQVARGEAIRRNLTVQLTLEPDTTGWTVCEAANQPCNSTILANPLTAVNAIQSRAPNEGTINARITTLPDGAIAVTFSPLGSVIPNLDAPATPTLTQVDVSNPAGGTCIAAGGTMRCLRIVVSGGGSVRMCDPTPTVVAPDPRACP